MVSAKGETATFNFSIDNNGDWSSLLTDIHAMLQKHTEVAVPDVSDGTDISESLEVLRSMEEDRSRSPS